MCSHSHRPERTSSYFLLSRRKWVSYHVRRNPNNPPTQSIHLPSSIAMPCLMSVRILPSTIKFVLAAQRPDPPLSALIPPQHALTNPPHTACRHAPLAALFAHDTRFVDQSAHLSALFHSHPFTFPFTSPQITTSPIRMHIPTP